MSEVREDSVELVIRILKTALGDKFFKTYYDGDPDLIPVFNLPALIVTKTADTSEPGTNVEDDVRESVVVKAIVNKADDWDNKIDPENMTEKKLRRIMEARDLGTGMWLPTTIKGALRSYIGTDTFIGETMSLELGVTPRPENLITHEAHLTIQVRYTVDIN